MTKLLNLLTGAFPARSETFVTDHATGLAARGWRVRVAAKEPGAGMAEAELSEIDAVGVERSYWGGWAGSSAGRTLQFGADALRDPGVVALLARNRRWTRPEVFAARRMRRLQNAAPHGVLHIHYGRNAALLLDAGWTGRAVVTWHGYDANTVPRQRGQDVYQDLFKRDWIHTVGSSFMKRRLVTLGAREDRIVKIPMGVDFTRFAQVDRQERPEGPLNVVAVGRLDEMKGYPVLIDAIAEALGRGVSLHLTIVGEGPDRASIEARIEARGLQDRVRLLGALRSDQVVRELAAADVFALTGVVAASGRVETQGVAYIEAQATGLPVIASDVGGVSESLDPGKSGVLTAEGDVAAVAEALVAYAMDPGLRFEHGQRGAEFVRAAFSMTDMLDAFEALYAKEAV